MTSVGTGGPTTGTTEPSSNTADPAEFVETALHDLRAPLRNIRQAMEWLAEHLGDTDGPTAEYFGLMREATDRIDHLAGALGSLGRIECHRLDRQPWPIDDLADEAADRIRSAYPAPWTLVVEEPRATIVADRALALNLLEAVFANSVEYRDHSRRLVVVVRVDGTPGRAVVEVTDNGIGMEDRYQDLVVEPFRRLHTRQEHPGSGLGLTIADRIARRHGGEIHVSSVLGQSTTVRFSMTTDAPSLDGATPIIHTDPDPDRGSEEAR